MVPLSVLLMMLHIIVYHSVYAQLRTNFVLKSFEQCDPKVNYPLSFTNATFWIVKNVQYVNMKINFEVPLDNIMHGSCTVHMLPGGNISVYLFTIHEKKACASMNKYLGEYLYDLERAAGLIPGMCPLPKGRHDLHNVPLHYEKISLQTFPFGNLRFLMNITDAKNKVMLCLKFDLQNRQ